MNINKKRVAIFGTVAAVAISGTGVAYAFFTSTGTGAGSATAGTSVAWSITDTATTGSPLAPVAITDAGPLQTATFKVQNNGTGVQHLNQVKVSIKASNGDPWTAVPGCSASDFSLNDAAVGSSVLLSVDADLAATVKSATQSVTIKMVDNGSNQDACKNASVPLYYEAS